MPVFEYKVIPAPRRGLKARGVKGTEAQFANALASLMNDAAADGWEYQRTDTLPCEERQGLTGRVTVFQNMLVFRRSLAVAERSDRPDAGLQLAVPVTMPALTATAPVVSRDVSAPPGPMLLSPDPRIAATLTRGQDAAPAADKAPDAADSRRVAAE